MAEMALLNLLIKINANSFPLFDQLEIYNFGTFLFKMPGPFTTVSVFSIISTLRLNSHHAFMPGRYPLYHSRDWCHFVKLMFNVLLIGYLAEP